MLNTGLAPAIRALIFFGFMTGAIGCLTVGGRFQTPEDQSSTSVALARGERDPATARAERYCVITPTEWNFHQAGAYSRLVAQAESGTDVLRLGVAVLDPCASVEFTACDGVGP